MNPLMSCIIQITGIKFTACSHQANLVYYRSLNYPTWVLKAVNLMPPQCARFYIVEPFMDFLVALLYVHSLYCGCILLHIMSSYRFYTANLSRTSIGRTSSCVDLISSVTECIGYNVTHLFVLIMLHDGHVNVMSGEFWSWEGGSSVLFVYWNFNCLVAVFGNFLILLVPCR